MAWIVALGVSLPARHVLAPTVVHPAGRGERAVTSLAPVPPRLSATPVNRRAAQPREVTGFLNKAIETESGIMPYVVYVPRDYTPEQQWPVILFLHGALEGGTDGLLPTQNGLPRALRLVPERYPALVVIPQCPQGEWWDGANLRSALSALDQTLAEYRIDPERQYLTGLSMGGYATWTLAAACPERWAAVVPICGGGDPQQMAPRLKGVPVWVFHGARDAAVPVRNAREMVGALRGIGSMSVRYTEFRKGDHCCWDAVYGDPFFARWLFQQRREVEGRPALAEERSKLHPRAASQGV